MVLHFVSAHAIIASMKATTLTKCQFQVGNKVRVTDYVLVNTKIAILFHSPNTAVHPPEGIGTVTKIVRHKTEGFVLHVKDNRTKKVNLIHDSRLELA